MQLPDEPQLEEINRRISEEGSQANEVICFLESRIAVAMVPIEYYVGASIHESPLDIMIEASITEIERFRNNWSFSR